MITLKTTEADERPYYLSSIPPDIQKVIFVYLDNEELLAMRAASVYYRDKVSQSCQDIWVARIATTWPNGKGTRYGKNSGFLKWSRDNNFNVHRANLNTTGFEEFMRRRRLDKSVLRRLEQLDVSCKGESRLVNIGGLIYTVMGLCESADNKIWIRLMEDGEDIIDFLKRNIVYLDSSRITPSLPPDSSMESIIVKSKIVLNGIYRLQAYQLWRYLMTERNVPHFIETGASVIAKFFLTINSPRAQHIEKFDPYLFDEIDSDIEKCLCELTNNIKSSLSNRLGKSSDFPLVEVIHQMNSTFGDDSAEKFRGNTTNYYDSKNSLIHEVLNRKTGIPITLAVVYAAVVRRVCGADLDLIGLPGHIVIGLQPFEESCCQGDRVFVDVFNGGKLLSYSDLKSIVAQYGIPWSDEMAEPISHQDVWQRMVRNLMRCQTDLEDDSIPRILITLQFLIDPRTSIETFHELILAPGFSAYTC